MTHISRNHGSRDHLTYCQRQRPPATGRTAAYHVDIRLYLVSTLCGDDDVELVDAIVRCREAARLLFEGAANVRDDTVEHDVGVLSHWTKVLRQTHEERHFLSTVRRVACNHH